MTDPDQRPPLEYTDGALALGMPLGGVGTGYTVLGADGRLGATTIYNDFPAAYTLAQPPDLATPFLAIRRDDASADVLALAPSDGSGDGQWARSVGYTARFPFARLTFALEWATVTVTSWSPFILGDAEGSNTPAAVFDVEVEMSADTPRPTSLHIAARFPMPSADTTFHPLELLTGTGYAWQSNRFGRAVGQALTVSGRSGVRAASMAQEDFVAGAWDEAADDGADGIAIVASIPVDDLGNGRMTVMHSWFYPDFQVGEAFAYHHMYGRRFRDVQQVAEFVDAGVDRLRGRSGAWHRSIDDAGLPDWLADSLINSLYCVAKNSWWSVDDSPDCSWGPNGLFTMNETFRDCPVTNTIPCHYFAHFPILWFFPELERSTLEAFAGYQLASGEIPFALAYGSGLYDPRYHCVHTANSAMFTELVARLYQRTGDLAWLRGMLPTVQAAMHFARSLDFDGDGLLEEVAHNLPGTLWPANNYHDAFPWRGAAAHTNGIWLSALASYADMCALVGDDAEEASARAELARAIGRFEELLWNGRYYRMYQDSSAGSGEASLTNQLCGEWARAMVGAPGLFSEDRVASALQSVLDLNVDPYLVPTEAVLPDGSPVIVGGDDGGFSLHQEQGVNCMVSEAYCAAGTLIVNGRKAEGLAIAESLWDAHARRWSTPFDQYYMLRTDTGEPVWGNDYLSNLVVWSLLSALDPDNASLPAVAAAALAATESTEDREAR
jgi:non-lysosomal glucosylceramidase